MLGLDGLKEVAGELQTSVGSVLALGWEAHGGAVGAAGLAVDVVRTRRVPCEADKNRTSSIVLNDLGNLGADVGVLVSRLAAAKERREPVLEVAVRLVDLSVSNHGGRGKAGGEQRDWFACHGGSAGGNRAHGGTGAHSHRGKAERRAEHAAKCLVSVLLVVIAHRRSVQR